MIQNFDKELFEMLNNYISENSVEMPQIGDVVRTNKGDIEGKVLKITPDQKVVFETQDGRKLKGPPGSMLVITKLADCDKAVMEAQLNELSNELLGKYKKAAGKDARDADSKGDYKRGDKRFKGIVTATNKQFDNDKKSKTNEAKFEYDKKTAGMKKNDSDPDQRHGLYIDGKLSKTYNSKEEADNVKKRDKKYKDATVKKIAEGSMGGINRVPNLGLKYDKVLDEVQQRWKQEQMEAIDPWHGYTPDDKKAGALAKAPKSAVQGSTEVPLGELIKDNIKTHGLKWAFQYHVVKHGLPPREFQVLANLVPKKYSFKPKEVDIALEGQKEDDEAKKLANQVKKQAGPVKKMGEEKYHGWEIRWDLTPFKPGVHRWMTWNEKRDPSTAKRGESKSGKDAFQDATAFINAGAGHESKHVKNAIIDFNGPFSNRYNPEEEPFWVKMDKGYVIISRVPQEGFHQADKRQKLGDSESFWSIPLKAAEAEALGMVSNGRYTLGKEELIDNDTSMFPTHFQNVVIDKLDKIRLGAPGFTVGTSRK